MLPSEREQGGVSVVYKSFALLNSIIWKIHCPMVLIQLPMPEDVLPHCCFTLFPNCWHQRSVTCYSVHVSVYTEPSQGLGQCVGWQKLGFLPLNHWKSVYVCGWVCVCVSCGNTPIACSWEHSSWDKHVCHQALLVPTKRVKRKNPPITHFSLLRLCITTLSVPPGLRLVQLNMAGILPLGFT